MDNMIELLQAARTQADCARRQVAAILVQDYGTVVGTGWNSLPQGSCVAGDCPRGRCSYDTIPAFSDYTDNCVAVHAEVMAIREAGERALGAMLVVTCRPCPDCRLALFAAGVRAIEIVDLDNYEEVVSGSK